MALEFSVERQTTIMIDKILKEYHKMDPKQNKDTVSFLKSRFIMQNCIFVLYGGLIAYFTMCIMYFEFPLDLLASNINFSTERLFYSFSFFACNLIIFTTLYINMVEDYENSKKYIDYERNIDFDHFRLKKVIEWCLNSSLYNRQVSSKERDKTIEFLEKEDDDVFKLSMENFDKQYWYVYKLLILREERASKEIEKESPSMRGNLNFILNYVAIAISVGSIIITLRNERWWNIKIITYAVIILVIIFLIFYSYIIDKQRNWKKKRIEKEEDLKTLRYIISLLEDIIYFEIPIKEVDVDGRYKNWMEKKTKT